MIIHSGGWDFADQSQLKRPEETFHPVSPYLLEQLGLLALVRGEWVAFEQILNSPNLAEISRIKMLKDAVDWMEDGEEIFFRF